MKILVTGGSGQVGFELRRSLAPLGEILAPTRQQLNLSDFQEVTVYLQREQPDLIVNAAAYTAVDNAETEPQAAQLLNAELPKLLAEHARERGIWLLHYSSDYVYPGTGTDPFDEASLAAPLGVYGHSKLDGDNAISASGCRHLIFRTSWVYSARGHNFMKTMLRLGKEREHLTVVSDQIGAPTPARLIAEVTVLAARSIYTRSAIDEPIQTGIYHVSPRGETSWHGYALAIFAEALRQGCELAVKENQVYPVTTAEYPTPAQRPLNSRLSVEKLERALGIKLPDWRSQLQLTMEELTTIAH